MEELTTPQLVRKYASLRTELAILSERVITKTINPITGKPYKANFLIIRQHHKKLDEVVIELRKRGVLD